MKPEELLDRHGGLKIYPPPKEVPHECELPMTLGHVVHLEYRGLLAYRAPCGHWWRPVYRDTYCEWRTVGRWRLRRWRRKGWLPAE